MKLRLILLGFLIFLLIISCENSTDSTNITLPLELGQAGKEIKDEIDELTQYMNLSIDTLKTLDFVTQENKVRQILRNIDDRYFFIDEVLIISSKGVLDIIEPEKYKESEGVDVSAQEHNQRLIKNRVSVTSKLFYVVEGYYAIVYTIPIIKNGEMVSELAVLIDPTRLLGVKLGPISKGKNFTFFVLEDTGVVLWDPDSTEVGRNTLTDSLYQQYPEVIKACTKITQNETGTTSYTFFNTGMNKIDKFDVWWSSIHFVDSHWLIVYKKENMQ
jgi:hypothetical protein